MAASDRLYELCCEVHDCEEKIDRLSREVRDLTAFKYGALELLAALDDDGSLPPWASELKTKLVKSG